MPTKTTTRSAKRPQTKKATGRAAAKASASRAAKKVTAKRPTAKLPSPPASGRFRPLAPERVAAILAALDRTYPRARCALRHENAWQLLVATILSAQCTDARVNMVTPELFRQFPTPAAMAKLEPTALEPLIRSTGFFRNKAKSIVGAARKLVAGFGGQVPRTMDELLTLPGVARKTANVVLGSWFGLAEGVVVDTHVERIARRLELSRAHNPRQIEQDLMKVLPRESWIDFSHQIIHHGRALCTARSPRCSECPLEKLCHAADKTWSTVEQHRQARKIKS
jgi:endonuclease-3